MRVEAHLLASGAVELALIIIQRGLKLCDLRLCGPNFDLSPVPMYGTFGTKFHAAGSQAPARS